MLTAAKSAPGGMRALRLREADLEIAEATAELGFRPPDQLDAQLLRIHSSGGPTIMKIAVYEPRVAGRLRVYYRTELLYDRETERFWLVREPAAEAIVSEDEPSSRLAFALLGLLGGLAPATGGPGVIAGS